MLNIDEGLFLPKKKKKIEKWRLDQVAKDHMHQMATSIISFTLRNHRKSLKEYTYWWWHGKRLKQVAIAAKHFQDHLGFEMG